MSEALGKKIWAFPDAFLPAKGHPYKTTNHGDQYGHESLCIINYDQNPANIVLDFLYEDQDPIENYTFTLKGKRSIHLRIDDIEVNNTEIKVKMTLTTPNCPVAESLPKEVKDSIMEIKEVSKVDLDLVWEPPWNKSMMSEAAKLELNL